MSKNITKAVVTDKNNAVTIRLVGYDYKDIAWTMVQLMDCATYMDKPATITAVDADNYSISLKGTDGVTMMAFMREIISFDEVVETMANNGIACQWELINWQIKT